MTGQAFLDVYLPPHLPEDDTTLPLIATSNMTPASTMTPASRKHKTEGEHEETPAKRLKSENEEKKYKPGFLIKFLHPEVRFNNDNLKDLAGYTKGPAPPTPVKPTSNPHITKMVCGCVRDGIKDRKKGKGKAKKLAGEPVFLVIQDKKDIAVDWTKEDPTAPPAVTSAHVADVSGLLIKEKKVLFFGGFTTKNKRHIKAQEAAAIHKAWIIQAHFKYREECTEFYEKGSLWE